MTQAIRILHVVGKMDMGGAESRLMDLYRNMDRDKIQFDFMQHTTAEGAYQKEVEELGGHVYHVPRFRIYNYFSYRKSWKQFLLAHPEMKVVHGHMTSTAGIYLPIAKKVGGMYTIAHARSAGVEKGPKGFATRFFRRNLAKKCDQCFTCSKIAGEAVFGNKAVEAGKVVTIPNAIQVERFAYDEKKREEMRKSLGFETDNFVIGHVGRFIAVKNHEYILEIFKECLKVDKRVRLLLLGDGVRRQEIEDMAKAIGVADAVTFAGNHKNVQDFYQAMDCFILPSFYEGLPGTAVEAQASGLMTLLSENVTEEAVITNLAKRKPITVPAKEWADEILKAKDYERKSMTDKVRESGFDASVQAERLSSFYLEKVTD